MCTCTMRAALVLGDGDVTFCWPGKYVKRVCMWRWRAKRGIHKWPLRAASLAQTRRWVALGLSASKFPGAIEIVSNTNRRGKKLFAEKHFATHDPKYVTAVVTVIFIFIIPNFIPQIVYCRRYFYRNYDRFNRNFTVTAIELLSLLFS